MADEVSTTRKSLVAAQATSLDLDRMCTAEEIAAWLGLSRRTVLELARQHKIPCVRFNERVIRFHPRTILNKK